MSRPPAYKMTDLDARANLSKNSSSFYHGRRHLELPGIAKILRLNFSLSICVDRKSRRAVKEANLPGVPSQWSAREKSERVTDDSCA